MKKIFSLGIILILMVSFVLAEGNMAKPETTDEKMGTENIETQGMPPDAENKVAPTPTLLTEQNKGEEKQIENMVQNKEMIKEYTTENGKTLMIQEMTNEKKQLKVNGIEAETSLEMTQEQSKMMVKLSNGKNTEIKIMPDSASENSLERLRLKTCSEENNCKIELKETGKGDNAKATYEIQIERHSRILGIFQAKMQINTQVNAENGNVEKVNKPWWAFLAVEPAEE